MKIKVVTFIINFGRNNIIKNLTNASLKMGLRYQRYWLYSVGALKGIFD